MLLTDPVISACNNERIQLGVSGADSYLWSPAIGDFFDDITLAEPTVVAVTSVYDVIGINEFGCTSEKETVSVQIIDFMINAGEDSTICPGRSTPLSGSVATFNSLLWESEGGTFSDPTIINPVFTPDAGASGAINISLTAEDDLCGTLTDDVVLNVVGDDLNFDAGDPIITCADGEPITLNGNDNGNSVFWSGGNGSFENFESATTNYQPNETGIFNLYLQSLNNCGVLVRDSVLINIQPAVDITTDGFQTVFEGESVVLHAEGGTTYEWWPSDDLECLIASCDSVRVTPLTDTQYFVGDPTADECSTPAMVFVDVVVNEYGRLWVPNAFSPNSDGQNDLLEVTMQGVVDYKFTVWNRYGQKVFETTDINQAWDGSFNGLKQPIGVFAWYAEYTFEYAPEKVESKMGNITLIR